jgi:preprotein translocase subunit YajC
VVLEIAPGIEVRYMKRAVMDVVSGPEADDAPADETDAGYYDDEHADDVDDVDDAHEADDVNDTAPPATSANGSATSANGSAPKADSEGTAYEQATGTKKD